MILVYLLTLIIFGAWIFKTFQQKKLILKTTPLDIPLLLFLVANILSTIFSIDPHTSIWGYYSRSNGGLLSLISYLLLYYAFVSNFTKEDVFKFLKAALLGGFLVSLWAIPEHFGASPSCLILTGEANASCWVQDVQARVFATLGQPNWLAAYLGMLIFPAFYFLLSSTKKSSFILYSIFLNLFYLAFTFTYSRGATLGLIAGLGVFIGSLTFVHLKGGQINTKKLGIVLGSFLMTTLVFGSALTSFKLISKFSPPPRPALTSTVAPKPTTTQLENGGTESGTIRLIVWRGALEIFKHYPIFGSGVETFAYSYYNFRPQEHNMVSEWDFLYNKAHNEFLNYLATTGLMGFLSYMAIIVTFFIWSARKILNKDPNYLIITAVLAAYTFYLVQNFFGFSVVIIALFFYIFPALVFVATDSTSDKLPKFFNFYSVLIKRLSKDSLGKVTQVATLLVLGFFILKLFEYYRADILFASGSQANDSGSPITAYTELAKAVTLNPNEPLYKSELGYAAATSAVLLSDQDATTSGELKDQAVKQTELSLQISPKNLSLLRTATRTYYILSTIDESFGQKSLEALDKAITLAPTDAKLLYNKAVILNQFGKSDSVVSTLEEAIKLKPNYREARLALAEGYFKLNQKDKSQQELQEILKFIPNDPEVLEKGKKWGLTL